MQINDSLTEVMLMSIQCSICSLDYTNSRQGDKTVQSLIEEIRKESGPLYKVAEGIAILDMVVSFCQLCTIQDYGEYSKTCPSISLLIRCKFVQNLPTPLVSNLYDTLSVRKFTKPDMSPMMSMQAVNLDVRLSLVCYSLSPLRKNLTCSRLQHVWKGSTILGK